MRRLRTRLLPLIASGLVLAAAPSAARATPASTVVTAPEPRLDPARLEPVLRQAAALPRLRALIIAQDGVTVAERAFRGPGLDRPVNIKSASKSVLSALVGIAIERGVFTGLDQPVAPILAAELPADPDPLLAEVTIDHLLSMRAGLDRTSGRNYGRWTSSPDWVRYILSRPFIDRPGGRMLYSTGDSHLLSAALTRLTGRSTLALMRDWLGRPLGITIPDWPRDPQGIHFGGNDMMLSPRALLRFGELYRRGGVIDGRRVLPEGWVEASWTPRTRSPFTGHAYGYGWFITEAQGHPVYYAWGYGGQMVYVVPDLGLTVVMTSDPTARSRDGYLEQLHGLLADGIVPAAEPRPAG
ncbi:serine hydrolase [Inquilinus sp. Marseille-Q2685]|uniref:serine hydrolase domain-containing protein n=1 Tax=Inquilinus sp. Marseille-Q2685 TaxID=2866581 RepID=UPI001CE415DE|nr:serine hydrolase [Inquilinus sp. Marseille-Q2685]